MTASLVDQQIRVAIVAGSLRGASYNRRLAQAALDLLPPAAHGTILAGLGDVEPFDEDVERAGFPPGAASFAAQLRAADAVLVVTPEYNGSIPGQLKNAFDWASRPDEVPQTGGLRASAMFGRPATVIASSNGQFGGAWARDEMTKVLRTQGARVVDAAPLAIPSIDTAFAADGSLSSDATVERLKAVLRELVDAATSLRAARARRAAT